MPELLKTALRTMSSTQRDERIVNFANTSQHQTMCKSSSISIRGEISYHGEAAKRTSPPTLCVDCFSRVKVNPTNSTNSVVTRQKNPFLVPPSEAVIMCTHVNSANAPSVSSSLEVTS